MATLTATRINARFDGRAFVPDEPVDLPVGRAATVEVPAEVLTDAPAPAAPPPSPREFPVLPLKFTDPPASPEQRREALEWILTHGVRTGRPIPDWALDREWIYAEDEEVAAEARRREQLERDGHAPPEPEDE